MMYEVNYFEESEWEYTLPYHLDNSNENNFTEELTFYKPYYAESACQLIYTEHLLKTEIYKECKNNWRYIAFTWPHLDYIKYFNYRKSLNGKWI